MRVLSFHIDTIKQVLILLIHTYFAYYSWYSHNMVLDCEDLSESKE